MSETRRDDANVTTSVDTPDGATAAAPDPRPTAVPPPADTADPPPADAPDPRRADTAAPAGPPASAGLRWLRARKRLRYDFVGSVSAVIFFCVSVTPSLLPRPWFLQG
jgi:hypothetical protein